MTYCGTRLTKSNLQKNYYKLGEIITGIHKISIMNSTRKLLAQNKSKKVQRLLTKTQSHHPYVKYLKTYKTLPQHYFSHGDLHINQIMINENDISIIDWESACLSYRIYDLSRILSHCLMQQLSTKLAQEILLGFTSVSAISDEKEIKLLLGLIWCHLEKTNLQWTNNNTNLKRVEFIQPLLSDRSLESIFKFNITH